MKKAMGVALSGVLLMPAAVLAEGPMLLGGAFGVSFEGGQFGDDVGTGYGFAAHGTYRFGEGPFAFRVSGVGTWHETQQRFVAVSLGSGGSPPSLIETRQHVFSLLGGPQLMRRKGAVRPYGYVLAGLAHFSAMSEAGDGSGADLRAAQEIQDDVFAWSVGAGLLFPLGKLLRLDVGARYLGSAAALYPGGGGFLVDGAELRAVDSAELGQFEVTLGLGFSF